MRRHPSLHPLSDDHHQGLVQARHLNRVGTPEAKLTPNETGLGFLEFWSKEGQTHFRKEEELLLPLYSRFGNINSVAIINMLLQHVEIRGRAQALRLALQAGNELPLESMRELGKLLVDHIQHEERLVFPMIEAAVPEEMLLTLGEFTL